MEIPGFEDGKKRRKKELELLLELPSGGAGFGGLGEQMEQPRDGETIPCGIREPLPGAAQGIPKFSSKRLFPTQYPRKFLPCAFWGFFLTLFFSIQSKELQEIPALHQNSRIFSQ